MDKTFLIILVIFITSGVFIYDQYVAQKIGVSPVAKVLDYTGQIKSIDPIDDGLRNVRVFATFKDNAQERLKRLQTITNEIENKRNKLINKRIEILHELTALDDAASQEAKNLNAALLTHAQDFLDLLQQVSASHKSEQDGLKALEVKFKENNIYYESEFRNLIQQLIKITDEDLKDLIYLYQQLELENQSLLDEIKNANDQYFSKLSYLEVQMEHTLENLPQTQFLKDKLDQVSQLNSAYQSTSLLLRQLSDNRFVEEKKFLKDIAQMMEIDIERLVNDQQYALSKNKNYVNLRKQAEEKMKHSFYQTKPTSKLENNIKPSQNIIKNPKTNLRHQDHRQKDVQRQMERARDKASDQGW